MRVVLVYIASPKENNGQAYNADELIFGTVDLPSGLGSIRAYCRQDPVINKECQFINRIYFDTMSSDVIADDILSLEPDVVAFSVDWAFEKTRSVKEIIKGKNPGIKIVLGGPAVPCNFESSKELLIDDGKTDALIMGEGEIAFRQLLKYYLNKEDISNIPNTVLKESGQIFGNSQKACLNDLSELFSPYLTGDISIFENAVGQIAFETSRGCIFHCAYCNYGGREKFRLFNLEKIKQEIGFFKSKGFRGRLFIVDPVLNFNKKWAKNVLAILEGVDFAVHLNLRPDLIDDEMIKIFTKIPRVEVKVGIQSIYPITLKNINRPINIPKCRETLRKLVKNKIYTGIDLITGLPGDNYERFKKTIDWAVLCGVQYIGFNDLMVLPNSDLKAMSERFEIKCNSNNMLLSNYSFSETDMAKASHFQVGFQFLFVHYRQIFHMLVFNHGYRPSVIVEKLVAEAEKSGEIFPGRLWDLRFMSFCDRTVLHSFQELLNDRQLTLYFFKLYKEQSMRLRAGSYV